MPNIASVLKDEISRLARKEVRAEMESLKKVVATYRSEIARLKKAVAELQKQSKRAAKRPGARDVAVEQGGAETESGSNLRFSAKGLATHRARLGLSAEQFGALVGVTGQSIYKWEQGKARPRASQLPAIAALRAMGKREAAERLSVH